MSLSTAHATAVHEHHQCLTGPGLDRHRAPHRIP